MKELDLLRQELLSCDTQLADILMKRFDVVEKIMALKEKNQMQILQPEQESRQKEALDIELKGNVYQEEIADIYARVLYNSKKIQGKKLFDYNIVLIGFMGAGKSTISAFLRDALATRGKFERLQNPEYNKRYNRGQNRDYEYQGIRSISGKGILKDRKLMDGVEFQELQPATNQ